MFSGSFMNSNQMTPAQLDKELVRLCGRERGNQSKLAALLGLHRSTVTRYLAGEIPIPEVVAIAVRALSTK